MFVDASVIVAILNKEPGWEELEKQLSAAAKPVYVSPLVRFEAVQGLARAAAENIRENTKSTPKMLAHARGLVEELATEVAAKDFMISVDIGNRAIEASMIYGKAVGHKADLNFGDCLAYAYAKAQATPALQRQRFFADGFGLKSLPPANFPKCRSYVLGRSAIADIMALFEAKEAEKPVGGRPL